MRDDASQQRQRVATQYDALQRRPVAPQAADEVEAKQREAILATQGAAQPDFLRTLNKET